MKRMNGVFAFTVAALAVTSISTARADDTADILLEKATAAFAERANGDLKAINETLVLLAKAEALTASVETKYDINILAARAQYFKGARTEGDAAKMVEYDLAMNKAKAATTLAPQYSESWYFYAISLGRWAEAKGITASLGRRKELQQNAETAMTKITRDGNPGETTDGYGPARTLGRMFFKLPGFAGGSNQKSRDYLAKAVTNAKDLALNTVYYAETLAAMGNENKETAIALLKELLSKDVRSYNPKRIAETEDEFNLGRELLEKISN